MNGRNHRSLVVVVVVVTPTYHGALGSANFRGPMVLAIASILSCPHSINLWTGRADRFWDTNISEYMKQKNLGLVKTVPILL